MMSFPLTAIAKDASTGLTLGPKTLDWVYRIQERPAYKRGMERMKDEEAKQVTGPAPGPSALDFLKQ